MILANWKKLNQKSHVTNILMKKTGKIQEKRFTGGVSVCIMNARFWGMTFPRIS